MLGFSLGRVVLAFGLKVVFNDKTASTIWAFSEVVFVLL